MTPLQMIAEWRKGCSCAPKDKPEECHECTRGLIDALARALGQDNVDKRAAILEENLALVAKIRER